MLDVNTLVSESLSVDRNVKHFGITIIYRFNSRSKRSKDFQTIQARVVSNSVSGFQISFDHKKHHNEAMKWQIKSPKKKNLAEFVSMFL
jgi:hypothetical protein